MCCTGTIILHSVLWYCWMTCWMFHVSNPVGFGCMFSLFTLVTPFDYLVVMADAQRMEQVLDNLLSNAIKYSPAGGPIELKVCVCEEMATAPVMLLSIHDHGIGIPTEQQSRIFNRFQRAN